MSKKPALVNVLVNGSQEIDGEFHGDGYPLTLPAGQAARLLAAGAVREAPAVAAGAEPGPGQTPPPSS